MVGVNFEFFLKKDDKLKIVLLSRKLECLFLVWIEGASTGYEPGCHVTINCHYSHNVFELFDLVMNQEDRSVMFTLHY